MFRQPRFPLLLPLLLLLLPSVLGLPQRQVDAKLRGNSFGLENFLFQSYETTDAPRIVKPKRVVMATTNPRAPSNDRGQTYGLENLSAQIYEPSRIKLNQRRPVEPTAESNRIKENFLVAPETLPEVTAEPPQLQSTERIRKRIMMRRRRKRPSNTGSNSDIAGNAIVQPSRIPIYPQVPKAVIRTKLPDSNRLPPVGVKSITMEPTQPDNSEEIKDREPPTTATEKSTTSTTRPTTTTENPSTINLKTFLKLQTETLSLSELLQTQNLSLADLLRGNQDASAILKARQAISSTTAATSTTGRRKLFNRVDQERAKPPKKIEVFEVTTARPNYNGFTPKIPRTKTNEPIINKPTEETREESTKPSKRPSYTAASTAADPQNRLNELRSKLRNFQKKTTQPDTSNESSAKEDTIETVPTAPKPTEAPLHKKNRVSFKSANNPDLPLILPNKVKPETETQKRPERLTNWTNRLPSVKRFGQDRLKTNEEQKKPLRVPILIENDSESSKEEEPKTTVQPEEEMRKPEPKDELIELLKSGKNADRLQKILTSRNMTLQELLDNREKPPLQTDISTLFANQQKHTTTSTSTESMLFDSLPDFQTDETDSLEPTAYDEPEAEESAPSVARVELLPNREPKQYPVSEKGISQLDLQPDDLTADTSSAEGSALWKLSEKAIYYGSSYGYGNFPAVHSTEKPKPELSESEILLLETIRRSQDTNRKFKLDLTGFVREEEPETDDIEKSYIPPAVKSAIIASGVVMGIALFVFIAIFAACGWKQRQIRLKGSSSVLGETLSKTDKSKRTLSPVSFKDTHSYKKTIDFDDETSESGTSNTSSYLWSTLKNTFTSRASTLKSRIEKEEKMREDKVTLRRNESRRKESRADDRPFGEEVYAVKKIDRDRNVINTSFNFKRSQSNNNVNHFNECVHGY